VVLDAAGVHQEAGLRRAPPLGRLADRPLGDARHLGGRRGVHSLTCSATCVEADGVVLDEVVIEPVVLDHQVQDAVEEGDVAPRLDRQEQVAGAGDRRDARIDDDDLRPVLARLPDVVGRDRRALGDVRPADPDDLGLRDVRPRVGRAVDAERLLVPRRGADHAEPAVVVDVLRLQADAGELAHQVRLLVVRLAPLSTRRRRAVLATGCARSLGDAADRLVVGIALKPPGADVGSRSAPVSSRSGCAPCR
jgi:hypothetical protein